MWSSIKNVLQINIQKKLGVYIRVIREKVAIYIYLYINIHIIYKHAGYCIYGTMYVQIKTHIFKIISSDTFVIYMESCHDFELY